MCAVRCVRACVRARARPCMCEWVLFVRHAQFFVFLCAFLPSPSGGCNSLLAQQGLVDAAAVAFRSCATSFVHLRVLIGHQKDFSTCPSRSTGRRRCQEDSVLCLRGKC